jgi:hypothetical protein
MWGAFRAGVADFLRFTPLEKILFVLLSLMLAAIIWSTLHENHPSLADVLAGVELLASFLSKRKARIVSPGNSAGP